MADDFFSSAWYRVAGLRPRLREHARIHRHRYRGEPWYVLEDRSSRRVHRFTPAAYLLIGMMDGRRTLDEIWASALERLGDDAPTQDEVIRLLGQMHAVDMVQFDVVPDIAELFDRRSRYARTGWIASLRSPLFVKLPLWDPDAFLERTMRFVRPLAGTAGLLLWLALVVPALAIVGIQWEALTHNFGDRVLSSANLLMLWCVFPVVKALHELGHAYATKSRGGEVHELGVMLLVFNPVPYVDSSGASAFRSKFDRALVGAAGMLVETGLAAIATFVWALAEPGFVRAVCFNVMVVAGVSTVVFNLNPLLRYDGYYILADLIEMPNLAQRSKQRWASRLSSALLGGAVTAHPGESRGERAWLFAYGPLSGAYRLVVMFSIAIFVASEFAFIGVVLAIWAVATGLVWPIVKGATALLADPRVQERRAGKMAVAAVVVTATAALLFLVPVPNRTMAEGVVWVPEEAQVRARASGFVVRTARSAGDEVRPGDLLIEREEPNLDAQAAAAHARVDELEARLTAEQFSDRVKADLTRRELEAEVAMLQRILGEIARLPIHAGASGRLVLPRAQDLPGRFVQRGELVGFVTQPRNRLVRVIVPQEDIALVRSRLEQVSVRFSHAPDLVFEARMVREVPAGLDTLPSRVLGEAGGGQVPADPTDPQGGRTFSRLFQFDVETLGDVPETPLGSRAHVRFAHAHEPAGMQAWRRIRQLFLSRFDV